MIENLYIDYHDLSLYFGVIFSKTDQICRGTTLHIKSKGDITCPQLSINKFLALRPHSKGPMFCHFGGSPMTRYQFTSVLAKAISALNKDTNKEFKSHSFRIGASTEMAMRGWPSSVIQTSMGFKLFSHIYSYSKILKVISSKHFYLIVDEHTIWILGSSIIN